MSYLLFRPVQLAKSLSQESEYSNGLSLVCLAVVKNVFFTSSGETPYPPPPPQKNATLLSPKEYYPEIFFSSYYRCYLILVEICMLMTEQEKNPFL